MRLIDADAITEDERQEHGFFYNSDLQELLDEQPTIDISNTPNTLGALDCISRQAAIDEIDEWIKAFRENGHKESAADACLIQDGIIQLPSSQPERLTDDDFETIRIHLNSFKENLCNQRRWKEAEEYQHIIDRFMMFASAQPERKKGKWRRRLADSGFNADWHCSECGWKTSLEEHGYNFCPNCGADMRGEQDG
jgi:rubrerythrin